MLVKIIPNAEIHPRRLWSLLCALGSGGLGKRFIPRMITVGQSKRVGMAKQRCRMRKVMMVEKERCGSRYCFHPKICISSSKAIMAISKTTAVRIWTFLWSWYFPFLASRILHNSMGTTRNIAKKTASSINDARVGRKPAFGGRECANKVINLQTIKDAKV